MNKKRRCLFCKVYKEQVSGIKTPAGFFCDVSHAINYANQKQAKQREKARKVRYRDDKIRVKTRSEWLRELQALVNKYVRLRDAKDGCISCNKPSSWNGQWHAGHYFSRGHSSALRFNLLNIHKQCSVCNNYLSGNIGNYTPRLIEKIGQKRFDSLMEQKSVVTRYEIDYLLRAITVTKKAIKRRQKML